MPLWLDLLRTPMAAPETRALRRMRLLWQALCLSLAFVAAFFTRVHAILGRAAPCLALALLVAAGLYTWFYLHRKNAADNAFLERTGEGR